MIRGMTLLSFLVMVVSSTGLLYVKHQVTNLKNELHRTYRKITTTEQTIHMLNAEWAYLNDPRRLQELADCHLNLRPTDPTQLVALNSAGRLQRNYHQQDLRTVLASHRQG